MSASDQLRVYEIHFVHHGIKKQIIHRAPFMSEANAWWIAAVESGVSADALPSPSVVSALIEATKSQGISRVRWNRAAETAGQ